MPSSILLQFCSQVDAGFTELFCVEVLIIVYVVRLHYGFNWFFFLFW